MAEFDGPQDWSAAAGGNPFAQEELLREGKAFAQLAGVEAVTVSGPDRLSWLHNLTTAPFAGLRPGASLEGLILDGNGHVRHAFAAWDDGAKTWLIADAGQGETLANFLDSMRFMLRVEVGREDVVAYAMLRDASEIPASVSDLALHVWQDPWPYVLPGGTTYGLDDDSHPAFGTHRAMVVAAAGAGDAVVDALREAGFEAVPQLVWEAARIVDRRPRPLTEIADDHVIPHELDWLRSAVSITKGCFPGQETVSKVINMGRPPRRLTFLYLEGPEGDLPGSGTEITLDGKAVGVLTSSARDYEEGAVGLALLKRSVPIDAVVHLGDFVASQEAVVAPEGRAAASPEEVPGQALRRARAALDASQKPKRRGDK